MEALPPLRDHGEPSPPAKCARLFHVCSATRRTPAYGAADGSQVQGIAGPFSTICRRLPPENRVSASSAQADVLENFSWPQKNLPQSRYRGRGRELAWLGSRAGYSCNCRLRDSTSSDSAVSLATSASILRTACNTVVWSRPPKRRPISGSERKVSVLARYIATWRGRTTFAVRREDKRSERLTLYCRATTR